MGLSQIDVRPNLSTPLLLHGSLTVSWFGSFFVVHLVLTGDPVKPNASVLEHGIEFVFYGILVLELSEGRGSMGMLVFADFKVAAILFENDVEFGLYRSALIVEGVTGLEFLA